MIKYRLMSRFYRIMFDVSCKLHKPVINWLWKSLEYGVHNSIWTAYKKVN